VPARPQGKRSTAEHRDAHRVGTVLPGETKTVIEHGSRDDFRDDHHGDRDCKQGSCCCDYTRQPVQAFQERSDSRYPPIRVRAPARLPKERRFRRRSRTAAGQLLRLVVQFFLVSVDDLCSWPTDRFNRFG